MTDIKYSDDPHVNAMFMESESEKLEIQADYYNEANKTINEINETKGD